MRFLVDQNLPPALAEWLRASGEAAEHVREIGMAREGDAAIATYARANGMIVITKDADFLGPGDPPVIWIRWGNVTRASLIAKWEHVWNDVRASLARGEKLVELADKA
jgi:predicted nuclease of predicted toxin-antitoxin system